MCREEGKCNSMHIMSKGDLLPKGLDALGQAQNPTNRGNPANGPSGTGFRPVTFVTTVTFQEWGLFLISDVPYTPLT